MSSSGIQKRTVVRARIADGGFSVLVFRIDGVADASSLDPYLKLSEEESYEDRGLEKVLYHKLSFPGELEGKLKEKSNAFLGLIFLKSFIIIGRNQG